MRRTMTLILGAALTLPALTGCTLLNALRGNDRDKVKPPVEVQPDAAPDVNSLVRYLNQNARPVQSLQARLDIDARQGKQPVSLGGWVAARGPRDFRMRGTALGTTVVDIGSNSEKFWFWVKQNNPPHCYFCTWKDLAGGQVNVPFPVEIDMVMAALNMSQYPESDATKYELKKTTGTYELIQETISPSNHAVRRVTVFDAVKVTQPGKPQVIEHRLEDARGTLVCRATVQKVEIDRGTGAVIPKKVTIEWPAQSVKMTLELSDIQVNRIDQAAAERSFTLDGSQYDLYDLARNALVTPSSQRQASPRYRR